MPPGGNGILSTVGSLLCVAQHGVCIGRVGCGSCRTLTVGQCPRSVPSANQQRRVISKDGCVFWLEAESAVEISTRLVQIAVFEFKLAGNEVGGSAQLSIPFAFEFRNSVGINLAILNNYLGKIPLIRETVHGCKYGQISGVFVGAGRRNQRRAADFDALDRTFGNRIGVFANVIFAAIGIFTNVVGKDGTAVFQMDRISGCRRGRKHHPGCR